jgi:hypothetical protein
LKNKRVVLTSNNQNTKIKSKSLGKVELKFVTIGDTTKFTELLQEQLKDKDFVVKILFNQLIAPKIEFKDFQNLSDVEIEEISRAFVKNEDYAFKYFKDTGDFFKDFKQAIVTAHKKQFEKLEPFEPLIKSAREQFMSFQKDFAPLIPQTFGISSYIQDINRQAEQFRIVQLQIAESMRPIFAQYNATAHILSEMLSPLIESWQRWAEQNRSVFEDIGKYWPEFRKRYKISEKEAAEVLQNYKWFVSPSMPFDFVFNVVQMGQNLRQKKGRHDRVINKLFVDYFSQNNWQNLEAISVDWERNVLFKKRIKIIQNCIKILKNSDNKTNAVDVVLPALIAQIDGFLTDYLDSKGISYDCAYDDFVDGKTGKVKKVGRKTQFKKSSSKTLTSNFSEGANVIFLNILFQHSQKGKPLKTPFNFNRHKIMHGESVNYGRKSYLIRAFLLIDFLVSLK